MTLGRPTPAFHLGPEGTGTLDAARKAADRAVGGRFGILRRCRELPLADGCPRLHTFVARGPYRLNDWWFCMPVEGTGVAAEPEIARISAIAEAIERYCLVAPGQPDLFIRAAFRDIEGHAVIPSALSLMSSRQYHDLPGLEPLTNDKVIDWCWTFSMSRHCPVMAPAALVHFNTQGRPPNNFLPELETTGAACHVSLPHAILAGLCEVLERDALTIAWQNRLPLIPLTTEGTRASELIAGPLANCDAEFSLFEIPTDSPFPVLLAIATSDSHHPHAVVGAACRSNPVSAAVKALCEAGQMLRRQRDRGARYPETISDFSDHADFYSTPEGARRLRENVNISPHTKSVADRRQPDTGHAIRDLQSAVAMLASLGREVLVADLTTADVAPTGFRVIRVFVPGAIDMSADERFPRLGGTRLFDLPVRLGLRAKAFSESDLNLLPGPLA